jgi:branched-chain amino acid transport system ATP-binding protein
MRGRGIAGEAVAVIGPNGAGKTTLMRVISGLIRPMRGSMHMEGADLAVTPSHRIVELGIAHVPENRRLFPRMTVGTTSAWAGSSPGNRPGWGAEMHIHVPLFLGCPFAECPSGDSASHMSQLSAVDKSA